MLVKLKTAFMGSEAGKVLDVPESEGKLLCDKGIADAAGDDVLSPVVAKAMETAMAKVTESMNAVIDQTLKQFQAAQEQARKVAKPILFGDQGDGDPEKNFGDWLAHAIKAISGKPKEAREAEEYLEKNYHQGQYQAKAALGESSGTIGGYTVPTQFYDQIQTLMFEETFFRARAFTIPLTSAVAQIPYLDVTTAQSAGVTAFGGGMQASWTAEAQTRTESEPAFKQLELRPWELSAYSVSSNILLQDSAIGLEKFLFQLFAKIIGWTEEYAFIQGNGVGKPQGFLSSNALIAVTRAVAGKLSYADVANCLSRLLPSSINNAIWIAHPYALLDLVQLRDAANRVVWVNAFGGATQKVPGQLFGLPVYISEKVPTYGSKGDLCLVDPKYYVIGDRMNLDLISCLVSFVRQFLSW